MANLLAVQIVDGVAVARKELEWSLFAFLMALKYEEWAALAEASREALKRSSLQDHRVEWYAFFSADSDVDPQGLDRGVTGLMGV